MAVEISEPMLRRVSWGATFAGLFVGSGIWLLLLSLGAGVGGATFDPRTMSGQGLGLGLGIWWIVSAIISFFIAGWLTARFSGTSSRELGMLQGVLVWGFMLVLLTWAGAAAMTSAAATAAQAAGQAAPAAGQAGAATGQAAQQAAQTAARVGTAAAWGFFIMSVLTLIAAGIGGRLGAGERRFLAMREEPVGRPLTPSPTRP